ncbi:MAG: TetR/AcrR family transcriptional repressor of nem operon [Kiritimatiellia bacterium]|jgi:TetR/AcrR family transcriptional repressor of nem operon
MARPRTFDEVSALDAAVQVFWQHGFAATSVRQLCAAMGIKAGSFYATFGNKEGCFRKAIDRYVATQTAPSRPTPDAIRAWFEAIIDPARAPAGCLLVNSATEFNSLDAESQRLIAKRLSQLEAYFARCLDGRPDGPNEAALFAAAVVGVHVLARSGASPARLRVVAEQALNVLD